MEALHRWFPALQQKVCINGTTNTNRTITGLVLDDGTYYVLYSDVGNPVIIAGVVQGTGTSSNGSFSSTDAKDFNLESLSVQSATVMASYVRKQSLNGTVNSASQSIPPVTFTSTYNNAYEIIPTLSSIAGTYVGVSASSGGGRTSTLTVSSSGVVSGSVLGGCTFNGSVAPRAKGNVYNASVTFGGAPCILANQTVNGIAYLDLPNKRLYAAALLADRSNGAIFVGIKP